MQHTIYRRQQDENEAEMQQHTQLMAEAEERARKAEADAANMRREVEPLVEAITI